MGGVKCRDAGISSSLSRSRPERGGEKRERGRTEGGRGGMNATWRRVMYDVL